MEAVQQETIYMFSAEGGSIRPSLEEVARYLGMRKNRPGMTAEAENATREQDVENASAELEPESATLMRELEACLTALRSEMLPRAVWVVFPLGATEVPEQKSLDEASVQAPALCIADMQITSRALFRNLAGCDHVALMAATLGPGADRLIARAQVSDIGKAVMLQAAAAACIETFCDRIAEEIAMHVRPEGLYLRPRFSPGYGDFPLSMQRPLLDRLEAMKKIGVRLTDSMLMTPSKSVTAVIGLSKENTRCMPQGCELCEKADCQFRRNA